MARLASQAVGGYFALPAHLAPRVAALLTLEDNGDDLAGLPGYSVVDPCAADGAALLSIVETLFREHLFQTRIYACELEATRAKALERHATANKKLRRYGEMIALHGDAFQVAWSTAPACRAPEERVGASLVYNNPPYDRAKEGAFVERFTSTLCIGGIHVVVIPQPSLERIAEHVALHYTVKGCFRFPGKDFDAYRQVVLILERRVALLQPAADTHARMVAWARGVESIPELPERGPAVATVPAHDCGRTGFTRWELAPVDMAAIVQGFVPWHVTDRTGGAMPIAAMTLPDDGMSLLGSAFPVAMPLKPAFMAAAIAAGVFDGETISPVDPALPPILAKGVYEKADVMVEEHTNHDGEIVAKDFVETPKLTVNVLDLRAGTLHRLIDSGEVTGAKRLDRMTTADLLVEYGPSLTEVMLRNCPVLHNPADPSHAIHLEPVAREPYRAQAHAAMAVMKILGADNGVPAGRGSVAARLRRSLRNKYAFLVGQRGSGKTGVFQQAAKTVAAPVAKTHPFRTLVLVPPHLLDTWRDEVAAVTPEARFTILREPRDLDDLAADKRPGMVFAVLTCNAAKLGHAWEGAAASAAAPAQSGARRVSRCPRCDAPVRKPLDELARTRSCCTGRTFVPATRFAVAARDFATALVRILPTSDAVIEAVPGRVAHFWGEKLAARRKAASDSLIDDAAIAAWKKWRKKLHPAADPLRRVLQVLVHERADAKRTDALRESLDRAIAALALAIDDSEITAQAALTLYRASVEDTAGAAHETHLHLRELARELALLLPPGSDTLAETAAAMKALGCPGDESWYPFDGARERLAGTCDEWMHTTAFPHIARRGRVTTWHGAEAGSLDAAHLAYERLRVVSTWRPSEPCGEPLYQAIKEPERAPIADYITARHRRLFDLVVVDEAHLYKNAGSAQTAAAMRIAQLGLPIIVGTGTWTGGYAEDYFNWLWTLDARFREEFARDERARFVECYGFLRFQVRYIDKDQHWPVAYGTVSDRVEKQIRVRGNAPGVQPTLFLRYVLPKSAVLLLQDVKADMPSCTEFVEEIEPTPEMASRLAALTEALKKQIKADKKNDLLRGKLWGAMAEIVSYPDLCTVDVGNADDGSYTIRYPNSRELGVFAGLVVAEQPQLPADTILPKEQWMLDQLRAQLARGRRCLVLGHHVRLRPRWVRLIREHLQVEVAHVDESVSAAKLDREIRKLDAQGVPVIVVNPQRVQTGLNCLKGYPTQLWMENPHCDAILYDQGRGRADRLGQTQPVELYHPVYASALPLAALKLLFHKLGVLIASQGLDGSAALSQAGVGGANVFDLFSVGKLLCNILEGEAGWLDRVEAPSDALTPLVEPARNVAEATEAGPAAALLGVVPPTSPVEVASPAPMALDHEHVGAAASTRAVSGPTVAPPPEPTVAAPSVVSAATSAPPAALSPAKRAWLTRRANGWTPKRRTVARALPMAPAASCAASVTTLSPAQKAWVTRRARQAAASGTVSATCTLAGA